MGRLLLLSALAAASYMIDSSYGFSTSNLHLLRSVPNARRGRMTTVPRMALRPPPGRKGFLIGLRESISYLKDGQKFIEERTKEFGPVFSTTRASSLTPSP